MFGYVKPLRAELLVRENEFYDAVYCGICRDMRLRYGNLAALTLSYDLVFLALLDIGLSGKSPKAVRKKCPPHPIRGRCCTRCGGAFGTGYSSDCGIILACAKLKDDLRDGAFLPKLRAAALLPVMHGMYRKAAKNRPRAAAAADEMLVRQRSAESQSLSANEVRSVDRLSEPTAAMLAAIFRELGGFDPDLRTTLSGLGYMLGRYIYICDALDDLEKDIQNGDANPFVPQGAVSANNELRRQAADEAKASVNLTLAALAGYYSQLPEKARSPLTDNIIYKGLPNVFSNIENKTRQGDRGKKKA